MPDVDLEVQQHPRRVLEYILDRHERQHRLAAVDQAVAAVAEATKKLLDAMVTSAPPKDRQVEADKARERTAIRFGSATPVG